MEDYEEAKPHQKQKQAYDTTKAVGIDVGLMNWLTLSDGKILQNTLNIEAQARKIKQLQRNLARKQKGSKNREKARIALAKAWRKIRRCRDDFVHKTSKLLAADNSYTLIVFEKLNINNIVKNHHLAKAIMDATWAKLRQLTAYKVERRNGGQVITVNPNSTSHKCSKCEMVAEKKLDLSIRMFECSCSCGLVIDRDLNAAINILKRGLELALPEKQPLLLQRKRISKFLLQGSKKPMN